VDAFQSSQPFQPYLFAGERVLWSGQPKQGIAFQAADIYLVPFSLFWMGMVVSMFVDELKFPDGPDYVLIFFMAFGLYFVVGRFFHDAWIRRNLIYAVTNKRVMMLRQGWSSKLTSREISALPMLELTEKADGTGTIVFDSDDVGYSKLFRSSRWGAWTPTATGSAQFFRIDNPRRVYELIRKQYQF
jgi:cytochrome c oxidase subunit IV